MSTQQLKSLTDHFTYSSKTSNVTAHRGNANILRNSSGEFKHNVGKFVRATLHKIKMRK